MHSFITANKGYEDMIATLIWVMAQTSLGTTALRTHYPYKSNLQWFASHSSEHKCKHPAGYSRSVWTTLLGYSAVLYPHSPAYPPHFTLSPRLYYSTFPAAHQCCSRSRFLVPDPAEL